MQYAITAESYALNGQIAWYVDYISIKLFFLNGAEERGEK